MIWSGTCRSRGFAVLAVGITLLLVAVGIGTVIALQGTGVPLALGWVLAVVGVIVGVTGWLLSSLEARVDATSFTVRFGPFGWPRRVIRLADVRDAAAIMVEPREWGGWGYRWIPWARASAAVIRRGPGIVLTLVDGRRFAVTVNDAAAGAQAASAAIDALPR
ncbi:MAG TPA: hypothetical protein VFL59_09750 [Candidatus Nanopelagicales bacterium]|nr:hypothetical protein [Candidatus Nanopelagicales bacterium]